MVVIFGWGAGEAKDLGEIAPTTCPNCRNQVFLHHIQTKKQVSLYFIPMASYGGTEYLSCPICRHGIQLGPQHQTALKSMRSATILYRKGGLAEAAYRASVERFWATLGMAPVRTAGAPAGSDDPAAGDPRVDPVAGRPARRPGQAACRRRAHGRGVRGREAAPAGTADRPMWMTTPPASGSVMGGAGPIGALRAALPMRSPGDNRARRGA